MKTKNFFGILIALLFIGFTTTTYAESLRVKDLDPQSQSYLSQRYDYCYEVLEIYFKMNHKTDDLKKLQDLKIQNPEELSTQEMKKVFSYFNSGTFERYYGITQEDIQFTMTVSGQTSQILPFPEMGIVSIVKVASEAITKIREIERILNHSKKN